ncbi:MAG: hypothetical protein M1438_00010 [Deltaproteobacteria bacterium]|nr:hypothetical protein [Deltaproteobacteria bacterium]
MERSPCRSCEREFEDKGECSQNCARLDEFLGRKSEKEIQPEETMPPKAKLSVAEAEKALPPRIFNEVMVTPPPEAAPSPKICKKEGCGRPVYKNTGLCLPHVQQRGRENAIGSDHRAMGERSAEVKKDKAAALAGLLEKFPDFNQDWMENLQIAWFEAYRELLHLIK